MLNENLISDYIEIKTNAYSKAFRLKFIENLFGFTKKYFSWSLVFILIFFNIFELFLSYVLVNSEKYYSSFSSLPLSVYIFSVLSLLGVYACTRFFLVKKINLFVLKQVADLRIILTQNLRLQFNDGINNRYLLIAKILNHTELFSLFLRNCLMAFLELIILSLVLTSFFAVFYPTYLLLWAAFLSFLFLFGLLISLMAKNLINVNQTFKSKIISELFFLFQNRKLITGDFFNNFFNSFNNLNTLDVNFRTKRNTWIDFSRSLIVILFLVFSLLMPLLSRNVVFWNFILDNSLLLVVSSMFFYKILSLTVNIGVYLPMLKISAFTLFQKKVRFSKHNSKLSSDFKIYSNKLKVNDNYLKDLKLKIELSKKTLLVSSHTQFWLELFSLSNKREMSFMYVTYKGKKMSLKNFLRTYFQNFYVLNSNLVFEGCFLELFLGNFDFASNYVSLKEYGLAEFCFEKKDITRNLNTRFFTQEQKIKLQLALIVTNQSLEVLIIPNELLDYDCVKVFIAKTSKTVICLSNSDKIDFKYDKKILI